MNIVVCIKQTPTAAEARLDDSTKRLVREGVSLTISSIDRRALIEGVRLRGEVGGTVTVLTMGPPQARSSLIEALARGADKAVHLSDPLFAGSDTLATARTLSMALKKLKPDLILCGKFTIDSETAQVPSELAEFLDLPQVTSIRKIRPTENANILWAERETDSGHEEYEVQLPALMSVTELIILPGPAPKPEDLQAAGENPPIEVWSAADLGADPSVLGAAGSPTTVAELRSAALERQGTVISGDDPEAAAKQLTAYLLENGLFQKNRQSSTAASRRQPPASPDPTKAVWVTAELVEGNIRPVTYELLGKAQDLANSLGGEVAAFLLDGCSDTTAHIAALGAYGADTVYVASDERLTAYNTELYTDILVASIRSHKPHVVLLPSTTDGRDLAPRVAARLQIGLTGDCVGLELDNNGQLAMIKPAFGGNIVSPIYSNTLPAMATVRPGMMNSCEPSWDAQPKIVSVAVSGDVKARVKLLQAVSEPGLGVTKLDDADTVVAIGQGIGGAEGVPVVHDLAAALNAAVAGSLRVATLGWLPPQLQIGLTGRTVAPRFYFAVAISGAPNHLVGTRKAQHIIAINSDPDAPIFKSANFGIVGDWSQIVPALTKAVLAAKSNLPD
ncbi:MAG: electron transfer flavoprotein alpha/ beta subunit [Dehalococcoidia bacterium]|nr:electron transfer flavoprotein alpha/ beta subunit [Dehalococcoidia bacterium]